MNFYCYRRCHGWTTLCCQQRKINTLWHESLFIFSEYLCDWFYFFFQNLLSFCSNCTDRIKLCWWEVNEIAYWFGVKLNLKREIRYYRSKLRKFTIWNSLNQFFFVFLVLLSWVFEVFGYLSIPNGNRNFHCNGRLFFWNLLLELCSILLYFQLSTFIFSHFQPAI